MTDSIEALGQASLKTAKVPDGGPYPVYPSGKSWDEASWQDEFREEVPPQRGDFRELSLTARGQ